MPHTPKLSSGKGTVLPVFSWPRPRARDWIASVLGAAGAIDELGRADAAAGFVTISSLNAALAREQRRAAERRRGYED